MAGRKLLYNLALNKGKLFLGNHMFCVFN